MAFLLSSRGFVVLLDRIAASRVLGVWDARPAHCLLQYGGITIPSRGRHLIPRFAPPQRRRRSAMLLWSSLHLPNRPPTVGPSCALRLEGVGGGVSGGRTWAHGSRFAQTAISHPRGARGRASSGLHLAQAAPFQHDFNFELLKKSLHFVCR